MKRIGLLVIVAGLCSGMASAQTTEELVNDGKNTENGLYPGFPTNEMP